MKNLADEAATIRLDGEVAILKVSPFAAAGARLIDNGYSAIPIMPGTKRPGVYQMKEWYGTNDWQRFCDRVPTDIELEVWNAWPDAGVCVALDKRLKVIDIDTDDPAMMNAVLSVLPDSEVKKRGKKGFSAFYRGSPAIVSAPFSVGKERVVDLLAHGRQTVMPPTIHPDTGQPYHWVGESLEGFSIDDLPELPDNIAEQIAAALEPFGYEPTEEHHRLVSGEGETYWREINDTALKNLPAWVPALGLKKLHKRGNGYRAVAHWRVEANSNGKGEALSIHPEGITDWGTNDNYTPIDLVMIATGGDIYHATAFLCDKLGIKEQEDDGFDLEGFIQSNMSKKVEMTASSATNYQAANDNEPFNLMKFSSSRFDSNPPKIEYLVDRSIEHGIPGIIPAMGDTGKSFLMLELCRRVAFGEKTMDSPIFGGPVVREGTSVFITAEDNEATVHRRICALDPKAERFTKNGDRLIVVPLPSNGGAQAFWKGDKNGLAVTDDFKRFKDALHKLRDVQLVCIDPLASFSHGPINEDPAAGQFVCTSLANLAAELNVTVLTSHHMRKPAKGATIQTLSDAREAIRGTTALVDGMRVGYALWPVEEEEARKICKELAIGYQPNSVVRGGVVKANGPSSRLIATYVRGKSGLLIDCSALLRGSAPAQYDLKSLLRDVVADAARDGKPYTKTGQSGLYERRATMPVELRISRRALTGLAEELLESGMIVSCLGPKATTVKWLDVPNGPFALGQGTFKEGAHTPERRSVA